MTRGGEVSVCCRDTIVVVGPFIDYGIVARFVHQVYSSREEMWLNRYGPLSTNGGYCWQILHTVIWPDLVAQEGASNANGEAHVGARGRPPNLATWRFNWGSPTVFAHFMIRP